MTLVPESTVCYKDQYHRRGNSFKVPKFLMFLPPSVVVYSQERRITTVRKLLKHTMSRESRCYEEGTLIIIIILFQSLLRISEAINKRKKELMTKPSTTIHTTTKSSSSSSLIFIWSEASSHIKTTHKKNSVQQRKLAIELTPPTSFHSLYNKQGRGDEQEHQVQLLNSLLPFK